MRSDERFMSASANRRGISLLEISVAAALLAVLLSATGQFLRVMSIQQRAAERRVVALQTVQAVAEQIGNLPPEDVTEDTMRQVAIPAAAVPYLPGARLEVKVANDEAPLDTRRVSISLSWNSPGGHRAGQVGLTTWLFPDSVTSEEVSETADE